MSPIGASGAIARAFLTSKLTPLLVLASLALGFMAVVATPREEEPQIVVPMIDVLAGWPGASAADVERLVVAPLERAIREIREVEYVYATSQPSGAMLVVRFFVNSDPERAIVNVRDKVANASAPFPSGALPPAVIPRSIDDVPILALTFSSAGHDPMALRRMAAECEEQARRLPDVAATTLIGGLLMLPQQRSAKKMQEVQPRLQELQKKYAKDREKLAQEQMRVYREKGINPFGSCLSTLVQFPIIIALYQASSVRWHLLARSTC